MAFDQPLEADRVDDLGFMSTFVRAPIVGTLMWILGGDEAKKQQEEEKKQMFESDDGACSTFSSSPAINQTSLNKMIEHNRNRKLGKKTAPRLIGSDLSDFGDCAIQAEAEALENLRLGEQDQSTSLSGKRQKKLSWSDEGGRSLVDVIDESIVREPSSQSMPHTQQRQVKSVMKRSRSTRNTAATTTREDADSSSSQSRYIPKGLSPNHNGLIMPTKPFSNSNDGHVSPQWGWYINTTPPTPDMFHRNSSLSSKPTDTGSSSFHRRPATLTNPAFKGIAGSSSHQKNPAVHHWPSVPL